MPGAARCLLGLLLQILRHFSEDTILMQLSNNS